MTIILPYLPTHQRHVMATKRASDLTTGDVIKDNRDNMYLIVDSKSLANQSLPFPGQSQHKIAGFITLLSIEESSYPKVECEFDDVNKVILAPHYIEGRNFPSGTLKILLGEGFKPLLAKAENFAGGNDFDPEIEIVGSLSGTKAHQFILNTIIEHMFDPALKLPEAELALQRQFSRLDTKPTPAQYMRNREKRRNDLAQAIDQSGDITLEKALEFGLIMKNEFNDLSNFFGENFTHLRQAAHHLNRMKIKSPQENTLSQKWTSHITNIISLAEAANAAVATLDHILNDADKKHKPTTDRPAPGDDKT